MTKRLSLVTQWFAPEPTTVPVWLCDSLRRAGWTVSVLTGIPNFPEGRVHAGYAAWRAGEESMRGVPVRRTPLYPSHGSSTAGRILNYLSWAASASALGRRLLRDSDVSLVYSSPATAALPALAAKMLYGKPYVLMVQDVWPDSIFASGFLTAGRARRLAERVTGAFVDATYRHATHVAVISPGMKRLLRSRGVPAEKLSVVYNWVDEHIFAPAEADESLRAELGLSQDDFVVMYAGTHGFAQNLQVVVEAFGLLPPSSRAHLVLVGDGVEKQRLVELASRVAQDRVRFLPPRSMGTMSATMAAADAQLVSLKDDPLFHITLPSKVQVAMCAGQPVLVSAPGDAARVVEEARAGIAVEPGNREALLKAVTRLEEYDVRERRALGENGRRFYLQEMSEAIGVRRLSELLTTAVHNGRHARNGDLG